MTGFDDNKIEKYIDQQTTLESFSQEARLNPKANQIKGVICGYRIEEIDDLLIRKIRYLDKLVDELTKGRKMEKILR